MANWTVSAPAAAFASRIAWRNDPAPASAVFVTVNVAADSGAARKEDEERRVPVASNHDGLLRKAQGFMIRADPANRSAGAHWRANALTMNTAICPRVLLLPGQ